MVALADQHTLSNSEVATDEHLLELDALRALHLDEGPHVDRLHDIAHDCEMCAGEKPQSEI